LERLQPAEYILGGAEFLLFKSYVLVTLFLVPAAYFVADFAGTAQLYRSRLPRQWEPIIAFLMTGVSLFLLIFAARTEDAARALIRSGGCPVVENSSKTGVDWLFLAAVVLAGCGFIFFQPKLLRLGFIA
jgi:hypothetical protein